MCSTTKGWSCSTAARQFHTRPRNIIEYLGSRFQNAFMLAPLAVKWVWGLTQALEQRQTLDAVRCLREQLVQLVPPGDPQHLHRLSTCLLADTVSEMYQLAGLPPGTSADSGRQNLITSLQVPLFPQSPCSHVEKFRFHGSLSLVSACICARLPVKAVQQS